MINYENEMIIDSFAGGGGASTGIELALGKVVDIAINHDIRAIQMHKQNHPWTKHYCENVFQVDPLEATHGRKVGLFWLSPDCTHFSKAKGGKPVKKEIRGLAWLAAKWASAVKPRVIFLENVQEFQTWGPIDKNGKPIKSKKGKTFKEFVYSLENQGYKVEWNVIKACDYGAPTIRKRLFLIARCDGKPIVWPKSTHGKEEGLLPYRTAAEIIDWTIPGKSIFGRKKPLSENTMKRIARGLEKFVFNNQEPFILQIGQTGFGGIGRVQSINEPLRTITRKNEHCVVLPTMIQVGYGEAKGQKPRVLDLNKPLGTIPASGNKFAVCSFISKGFGQFGKTIQAADLNNPLPTVTASDHNQLVTASFIERQFSNSVGHKVDEPLGTITANDKSRLVQAFLIKYFGGSDNNQSINEPLHTITSKDRFGLVTIKGIDYQIIDIQMRMLEPKELYAAQGFPKDYIFEFDVNGKKYPKTEQVARCGNSVCPQVVTALVKANLAELAVKKTIETMEELKQVCGGER